MYWKIDMQLLLLINVTPVDTLFYCVQGICRHTLPTTNIFALKIDGWKMKGLPFGASSADFQGGYFSPKRLHVEFLCWGETRWNSQRFGSMMEFLTGILRTKKMNESTKQPTKNVMKWERMRQKPHNFWLVLVKFPFSITKMFIDFSMIFQVFHPGCETHGRLANIATVATSSPKVPWLSSEERTSVECWYQRDTRVLKAAKKALTSACM